MKSSIPKNQPNIFIKIAGLVLMILGLIIIINPEPLNLKLGFSSIIIGIFMIVIISEESENKKTDYCYKGNAKIIIRILEDLEINGNAIFIPKSNQITEEKILIPPNKEGTIKIPEIKNNDLFLKGNNNENLGIVLPPSGLELLNNIEKEVKFENTEIGNIEEKLQIFVRLNIVKSLRFIKISAGWTLEIESPELNDNQRVNVQYPNIISSAVITAITRALNQKIRIYGVKTQNGKIIYHLNILRKKE